MLAPRVGTSSPWGTIEAVKRRAGGIYSVETIALSGRRHGGYWLSIERVAEMPAFLRTVADHYDGGQWFEQDCEAYRVALAYPDLLPDVPTREAVDTLSYFHAAIAREFATNRPR